MRRGLEVELAGFAGLLCTWKRSSSELGHTAATEACSSGLGAVLGNIVHCTLKMITGSQKSYISNGCRAFL